MASSKSLLFLFGVLFALVLLISSDVTVADQQSMKTTGVHDVSSGAVHQSTIKAVRCTPPRRCCAVVQGVVCVLCCPHTEETPNAELGD